jgi:hypothetical protein
MFATIPPVRDARPPFEERGPTIEKSLIAGLVAARKGATIPPLAAWLRTIVRAQLGGEPAIALDPASVIVGIDQPCLKNAVGRMDRVMRQRLVGRDLFGQTVDKLEAGIAASNVRRDATELRAAMSADPFLSMWSGSARRCCVASVRRP